MQFETMLSMMVLKDRPTQRSEANPAHSSKSLLSIELPTAKAQWGHCHEAMDPVLTSKVEEGRFR